MIAVVLRFVCVFAVFCGALGAPTVTYDQRQQGEFNLQVDLNDIGILLLPGSEFAKKNVLGNGFVRQMIGRYNGVSSKKKHNKKPADCSTTTTEKPEVPYGESSGNEDEPTSSISVQENSEAVSQVSLSGQVPVLASSAPADAADNRIYPIADPYSVTPSTPNFSDKKFQSTENKKYVASKPAEIIALRNVQKPAASVGAVGFTELVAVKTVEKSADAAIVKTSDTSDDITTEPETTAAVHFEEKPVSYTKTVVTTTNDVTAKTDTKEEDTKIEDKLNEMSAVKIVENSSVITESAKVATAEQLQTEKKPVESISLRTIMKPEAGAVQELSTTNVQSSLEKEEINTKKTDEPVQMVAMKTMEKPTFADALKATKKPVDTNTDGKTAATGTSVMPSINSNKKPTETVVKKTVQNSSSAGFTDTVDKSGITTSTKIVEIQDDNKTPTNPNETAVVSRSAPKLTEMVAVKTVENPATVSTVKSVISVKTMIKPTVTPKTAPSATNSSITMRKVGDRKPLPTMTLEVASPIVTV